MNKEISFVELRQIVECRKNAESNLNKCYHPNCEEETINSHILQRNGILSEIAQNSHLWHIEVDNFKEGMFHFKRRGLKSIMTFNGFCVKHDTEIFKDIEGKKIDFNNYKTHILFALRTQYNELFRKEVNLKFYGYLVNKLQNRYNNERFHEHCRGTRLGIQDMKIVSDKLWNDILNNTESYSFRLKYLPKVDLVISSSFNYVTSNEASHYKYINGKEIESLGELFINLLPYGDVSLLLMGYNKSEEAMIQPWFNKFFDTTDEETFTKITNLILFQCETWACNDEFYDLKIKGIEEAFYTAINYALKNGNERQFFKLNIFGNGFKEKFVEWSNGIKKAFPQYF